MSIWRPHPISSHLRPWLAAIALAAACAPNAASTPDAAHPGAAASAPVKPELGVYKAPPRASVVQGQQITPMAWVHADVASPAKMAVTVLFLYEQQATRGEQVKMDTITLPIDVNGNFSGVYGDIRQISGYVIGNQARVASATIDNQKGKPSDSLTGVDLTPSPVPSADPAARAYPVTQVLPVSITQPYYTNFWNVTLNVVNANGKRAVQVRYDGPTGTYTSPDVPFEPNTRNFRGTATMKGSSATVSFAGTFAALEDGVSPARTPNFPILSQVFTNTSAQVLSDAVGTESILWLESSTATRSGVVLGSAPFSTAGSALAQMLELRKQKNIVAADMDAPTVGVTAPPNDPYFRPAGHPGQYPYPTMNGQLCCTAGAAPTIAADAWGVPNADGTNIQVAVLDTGVIAGHADLGGKVLGGHNALKWPWWCDWLRLWIPANWRTDSSDLHGHGTAVAGIITANRNNGIGVAGTVANARIVPVRVLDEHKSGTYQSLAEGITWLLDNNLADIVNISLISPITPATTVAELVRRSVNQGRMIVAASGNSAQQVLPIPAALPDVISVAASEPNNDVTDYSGVSIILDMMAPGGNVGGDELTVLWKAGRCNDPVWDNNANYCMSYGTSFATPYAAAVGAMLLSATPNLRRNSAACVGNPRECVGEATSILQATGLPIATPNWAPAVTHVNLVQAHTALVPGGIVTTPPTRPSALNTPGCASYAACTAPGLRINWTAAPPPPAGLVLQGYLLYRNGELLLAPASPNPVIIHVTHYDDTRLPTAGGALVAGRYTYTVTALYDNAAQVKRESLSAPALAVDCTATTCQ